MTGRPKVLIPELMAEICERITVGEPIRQIAQLAHMPAASTIYLEPGCNPAFSEQYAQTREAHLIRMEDELLEIADDASNDWMEQRDKDTGEVVAWQLNGEHIQHSRVRIDSRKWLTSKRARKKPGDRVPQDVGMGARLRRDTGCMAQIVRRQRLGKVSETRANRPVTRRRSDHR